MAGGKAALAPARHQASGKRLVSLPGPGSFLSPVKVASPPARLALLPNWGSAQASARQNQELNCLAALA